MYLQNYVDKVGESYILSTTVEKAGRGKIMQNEEQLIPANLYESQPYWAKLAKKDQRIVDDATQMIGQLTYRAVSSRLELGKYFITLKKVLRKDFRTHIRAIRYTERTAYRIISDYSETQKLVPMKTLPVVMSLNYDFGKPSYRRVLKQLPAPKSSDPSVVQPWCEKVEEKYRATTRVRMTRNGNGNGNHDVEILGPDDRDQLMKEAFRFSRIRLNRLPRKGTGWKVDRVKFVTELAGYLYAEAGREEPLEVNPATAPSEFLRNREAGSGEDLRGRPVKSNEVN